MFDTIVAWEIAFQKQEVARIANEISIAQYGKSVDFALLPGIRAYFPCSTIGSNTPARTLNSVDPGGFLLLQGDASFGEHLDRKCIEFDGTGDYLDGGNNAMSSISGIEAYVSSDINGLTVGGWYYFEAAPLEAVAVSKWNTSSQRSWNLRRRSDGLGVFSISSNGNDALGAISTSAVPSGSWVFMAGRYTPSGTLSIWINQDKWDSPTVATSVNISTAELFVGARDDPSPQYMSGKVSDVFICASALSDLKVRGIYELTKGQS